MLLTDPIDEFWTNTLPDYKGKKFLAVQQAGAELEKLTTEKPKGKPLSKDEADKLISKIKATLGDEVKDVQTTDRLTKSPMSLITGAGQMSLNLERLMRAHGQQTAFNSDRILQINPYHPLIHKMAKMEDPSDYVRVLFDQTLVIEGEPVKDPARWTEKLTELLLK